MAKAIWFSQPSNHSGYLNLLYLTSDGDIGRESTYTDLLTGYFIMGGPTLIEEYEDITEAGLVLLSRLENSFHFYPASSEARIRKQVEANKAVVSEKMTKTSWEIENLMVFSKKLSDFECLSMLLRAEEPSSPIAFVDRDGAQDEDGLNALCQELALLYYRLPKDERKALKLKQDWSIPST